MDVEEAIQIIDKFLIDINDYSRTREDEKEYIKSFAFINFGKSKRQKLDMCCSLISMFCNKNGRARDIFDQNKFDILNNGRTKKILRNFINSFYQVRSSINKDLPSIIKLAEFYKKNTTKADSQRLIRKSISQVNSDYINSLLYFKPKNSISEEDEKEYSQELLEDEYINERRFSSIFEETQILQDSFRRCSLADKHNLIKLFPSDHDFENAEYSLQTVLFHTYHINDDLADGPFPVYGYYSRKINITRNITALKVYSKKIILSYLIRPHYLFYSFQEVCDNREIEFKKNLLIKIYNSDKEFLGEFHSFTYIHTGQFSTSNDGMPDYIREFLIYLKHGNYFFMAIECDNYKYIIKSIISDEHYFNPVIHNSAEQIVRPDFFDHTGVVS